MVTLSEPTNDFEERIHVNIKKYGYQVNTISDPDGKEPQFVYSIGFWKTYDHPEIIIFGLHNSIAHSIIQSIDTHLNKGGAAYKLDSIHTEFIEGFECTFKPVPPEKTREYLLSSRWLYGRDDFPVMQLVFQHEDHQWPWDTNASERFRRNQPILGFIS